MYDLEQDALRCSTYPKEQEIGLSGLPGVPSLIPNSRANSAIGLPGSTTGWVDSAFVATLGETVIAVGADHSENARF